jgi:hypothetical protein
MNTGSAALVGAGVGLTTGAVLGALYPHERWKRVRLNEGCRRCTSSAA